MAVVALIPAAGLGTRFHDAGPKALVRLAGRPFLLHALARLGYLYLNQGRWGTEQVLPEEFVRLAGRPER